MASAPDQPDPARVAALLPLLPGVAELDDAAAAAALSTPVLTPRPGAIQYTVVGSLLGPIRAAEFRAALLAAGPLGGYVNAVLAGNGFDATSPQVPAVVAQLVGAALLTQDEATAVLYLTTYPAGGPVTEADVAAARAIASRAAGLADRRRLAAAQYNAAVARLDALDDGGPVPARAEVLGWLGTEAP